MILGTAQAHAQTYRPDMYEEFGIIDAHEDACLENPLRSYAASYYFGASTEDLRQMLIRDYSLPADTPITRQTGVFATAEEHKLAVEVLRREYINFLKGAGFDIERLVPKKILVKASGQDPASMVKAAEAVQPELVKITRKFAKMKGWKEFYVDALVVYATDGSLCFDNPSKWPVLSDIKKGPKN